MIGAAWAILAAVSAFGSEDVADMTPRLSEPRGPGTLMLQHHDARPLPKPASQKKRRKLARRGRR